MDAWAAAFCVTAVTAACLHATRRPTTALGRPPWPPCHPLLEICCDTIQSVRTAVATGAGRVELCANLLDGGTTPSAGLIRAAVSAAAGSACRVNVLVRPRGGDFVYTEDELRVMEDDIRFCKRARCHAVVVGVLDTSGHVDVETTRRLVVRARDARARGFRHGQCRLYSSNFPRFLAPWVSGWPGAIVALRFCVRACMQAVARPMLVTFHRAIDMAVDPVAAVAAVIATGCDKILTSGGAQAVLEGASTVRRMTERAGGKVDIIAAAGVTEDNAAAVLEVGGRGRKLPPALVDATGGVVCIVVCGANRSSS